MSEKLEQDITSFMNRQAATRLKISTPNFDRDYRRNSDGNIQLVSEKAVIRTLGKVTKVPIGEHEQHKTFEDAEKATKKHWQEYYKKVRAARSDAQKLAEARRQQRYRERRKATEAEFKHRKN